MGMLSQSEGDTLTNAVVKLFKKKQRVKIPTEAQSKDEDASKMTWGKALEIVSHASTGLSVVFKPIEGLELKPQETGLVFCQCNVKDSSLLAGKIHIEESLQKMNAAIYPFSSKTLVLRLTNTTQSLLALNKSAILGRLAISDSSCICTVKVPLPIETRFIVRELPLKVRPRILLDQDNRVHVQDGENSTTSVNSRSVPIPRGLRQALKEFFKSYIPDYLSLSSMTSSCPSGDAPDYVTSVQQIQKDLNLVCRDQLGYSASEGSGLSLEAAIEKELKEVSIEADIKETEKSPEPEGRSNLGNDIEESATKKRKSVSNECVLPHSTSSTEEEKQAKKKKLSQKSKPED